MLRVYDGRRLKKRRDAKVQGSGKLHRSGQAHYARRRYEGIRPGVQLSDSRTCHVLPHLKYVVDALALHVFAADAGPMEIPPTCLICGRHWHFWERSISQRGTSGVGRGNISRRIASSALATLKFPQRWSGIPRSTGTGQPRGLSSHSILLTGSCVCSSRSDTHGAMFGNPNRRETMRRVSGVLRLVGIRKTVTNWARFSSRF